MIRGVAIFLGLLFVSIGAVMLGVAFDWTRDDAARADGGLHTEGTVIELVSHRASKGKIVHRPIVVFRDAAGGEHRFVSGASSSPPAYAIGERVPVIYNPADPARAEIDGFVERRLGAVIFAVLGGVFAVVGALVLYGLWRNFRNALPHRRR